MAGHANRGTGRNAARRDLAGFTPPATVGKSARHRLAALPDGEALALRLSCGESVVVRARIPGHDRLGDAANATVAPVGDPGSLRRGDVVLCQVERRHWLLRLNGRRPDGNLHVGDDSSPAHGWVEPGAVSGLVVAVA